MSRPLKLFLMFSPLVLFFIGLAFLVGDMRHPAVASDQCVVTATGKDVERYKNRGDYIYRQGSNPHNDVSLRCNRMGHLLLNDAQLFVTPVKAGQAANVSRKKYQLLPVRWAVSVQTGLAKQSANP